MRAFTPGAGWTEVARFEPPRRAIAGVFGLPGIANRIPADIRRKVEQPGVAAIVYRTP